MTCDTTRKLYEAACRARSYVWAKRNPREFRKILDEEFKGYTNPDPGEFYTLMLRVDERCAQADGLPPYAAWCGARTTTGRAA